MHENSGLVYERVLTEIHCIKYMYYDCQICPIIIRHNFQNFNKIVCFILLFPYTLPI